MYVGKFHKYKIAAICMSSLQDDSLVPVVKAICEALNTRGYKTLIFGAFADFRKMTPTAIGESSIFNLINHDIVDVLIMMPQAIKNSEIEDKIVSTAKKRGTNVISVDGIHKDATSLIYNYEQSFEAVCRHVIEHHGCKDIFFMAGKRNNKYSNSRIATYKKVLEDNNLPFVEEGRFSYGDFWSTPTKEAMNSFFEGGYTMPDAFICANDIMAITVIKALRKRGYRVPEDVIVTGFDASQSSSLHTIGEITSSMLDISNLARCVADTCDNYLAGKATEHIIKIKYQEQFAQSCGCKPSDENFLSNHLLKIDDYNTMQLANEIHMANYYSYVVDKTNYLDMISEMVEYLENYSGVCVNEDFLSSAEDIAVNKYHDVYSRRMIAICQKDHKNNSFDQTYPTEDLIPDLERALKRYNSILFAPLNFQQSVIGYYFTAVEPDKTSFRDTRRLVIATNQILENFRNTYKLTEAYRKISITHRIDHLTGIYNRRGYFQAIEERLKETTAPFLLMLSIDMDRLKQINDTFGHSEGDKAIVEVANAIRSAAGQNGIYARFGGDEFILTLPCDNSREASKIIGAIQTHIDVYNRKNKESGYEVSVSIGHKSIKLTDSVDIHKLITETDRLMYVEKRAKKAKAEASFGSLNSVENPYEARIHEIFSSEKKVTHFYLDYVESKWHIMQHEDTPPCICSKTVGPLRAMWLSGCIYPDDKSTFAELAYKIKSAFDNGVTETSLLISLRLTDSGEPLWYNLRIQLMPDEDGKLKELAGSLYLASDDDIMNLEMRPYYASSESSIAINEAFSYKLSNNKDKKYAFIQFDIQRFKRINEIYGEETGTDLLLSISRQLKAYCSPYQICTRVSSDVFSLLTPYETKEDILEITSTLQERLKGFRDIKYNFSFGVYLIDDIDEPVRLMEDKAAAARLSIKASAMENVAFYDGKMHESAANTRFVESNMLTALENNEFVIFLQPKFSISKEIIVGYEALVRWNHPRNGLIPPFNFIPIFEKNGFIAKLDYYVWESACQVLEDWKERGFALLPISVNVSRAHLRDDTFIRKLDELTHKYDVDKKYLELEITESVEGEQSAKMIQLAKEHGYTLLMDDFGAGYSSLSALKSSRFDVIKIDRSFLSGFMTDERGKKIISHTISMSRDMGLELIAEGVETLEQAKFLESCGCDIAQGYYYAKPMPVQEAEIYLHKNDSNKKE